jgi:hypothetical protein
MLITPHFLVINLPKSGSSFVRSVIKAIFARQGVTVSRPHWIPAWYWAQGWLPWRRGGMARELILPNVRMPGRPRDQHGTTAQIPPAYRDRAIVSVMRDPFGKAVSEYRFRWWVRYPPLSPAALRRDFPAFPNLLFDDFLRLSDTIAAQKLAAMGIAGVHAEPIGNLTTEFVQFFFHDPSAVLRRLSDEYVAGGAFRSDMVAVEFLRQEALAEDLAAYLARAGFDADEVELARTHAPVNVTDGTAHDVTWTRWGVAHFAATERYLLAMLAVLGFRYDPPEAPHEVPTRLG